MRILIVYNTAMEPRSISGVFRYFEGVVPQWQAAGHEVDFVVARAAQPLWRSQFPGSRLISSDDWVPAPQTQLGNLWCFPAYAWRMLPFHYARKSAGYDVYYACAPFLFEVFPAARLARKNRAALVVKVHHMVFAQSARRGLFDQLFVSTERQAVRLLHREADLILGSTPLVASDYNRLETSIGLPPRPVHCTGYAVNLTEVPFSADAPKEFDAVVLGRIHEHKGVFDAPEVWKSVCAARPDARLLVIGDGPHRGELERRFAAAGLAGRVMFTGAVSDAEKTRWISRCRVGLSFSREEGWGLSVHEFLAFGLPVVAMDLPVFEQVFPGQLDLVARGDTARFATRVLGWLDNPVAAREQGVRGRAFVARYDTREVARRELAAMEEAVGRRRGAP